MRPIVKACMCVFQNVHMSAVRDQTSLREDTVHSAAGSRYIRQILSAICYLHAHRWDNQLLEDCQQNCSWSLSSKTSYRTGVPPRLIWKLRKEFPPGLDRTSCVADYWHSLNGWEGSKLLIANASMTGQIDWRLRCLTLPWCVGQRIFYELLGSSLDAVKWLRMI